MSEKHKKKEVSRVEADILDGLSELLAMVRSGKALDQVFTVKTVDLVLTPRVMDAEAIRLLRVMKLQASQAVFAAVLGVSVDLVEAWEQGRRRPKTWALRMMHMFNDDPKLFRSQIRLKQKPASSHTNHV